MSSAALIRSHIESRLPGALTTYSRPENELAPTGIPAIDRETGGIPKGAITQICAPAWRSSGKTTLLLSLMAQSTGRGEFCALVDAGDCFDPASAQAAGVDLTQVLWVRCSTPTASCRGPRCGMPGSLPPLEQAFKAADILIQNGGFGLLAVDLGNSEERTVRRIPLTSWFRFARVVEKMPAALVFLVPVACAESCAALTIHLGDDRPEWHQNDISHGRLLNGLSFQAGIARARLRKPVQGAGHSFTKPGFTARSQWAGAQAG